MHILSTAGPGLVLDFFCGALSYLLLLGAVVTWILLSGGKWKIRSIYVPYAAAPWCACIIHDGAWGSKVVLCSFLIGLSSNLDALVFVRSQYCQVTVYSNWPAWEPTEMERSSLWLVNEDLKRVVTSVLLNKDLTHQDTKSVLLWGSFSWFTASEEPQTQSIFQNRRQLSSRTKGIKNGSTEFYFVPCSGISQNLVCWMLHHWKYLQKFYNWSK